jgi:hypothetical protein
VLITGLLMSVTILAQECPLQAPLILKDTQDGFAGQTGTIWTVTPDCSFTVAHQIGATVSGPFRQGRLTQEQQVRLRELLARTLVAGMPEQLGSGPQVNARRITLFYGGRTSVLILAPGGGDLGALRGAAGDDAAARLLGLADTLNGMTGG